MLNLSLDLQVLLGAVLPPFFRVVVRAFRVVVRAFGGVGKNTWGYMEKNPFRDIFVHYGEGPLIGGVRIERYYCIM